MGFPAKKKSNDFDETVAISKSGHQDSNLGPPAPKAGTLTELRYAPNTFQEYKRSGERGIRTLGTVTRTSV